MKLIREPFSLTAKFDYVLHHEQMVAIVEVRKLGDTYSALWWVSGLTGAGRLAVAFQAQFALPISSHVHSEPFVLKAAPVIFEIAKDSLAGGGVKPVPLMDSKELPKALASTFIRAFELVKLFQSEGMELNQSTGLQYEFCQLLKVPKPVEFLASFLGVPVSTVRQRITWARNKGVLSKQRLIEEVGDA